MNAADRYCVGASMKSLANQSASAVPLTSVRLKRLFGRHSAHGVLVAVCTAARQRRRGAVQIADVGGRIDVAVSVVEIEAIVLVRRPASAPTLKTRL